MTRQRRYQLRQRAAGRCIICGGNLWTKSMCRRHAASERDRKKRYRLERLAAGTCMHCDCDRTGAVFCDKCALQQRVYQAAWRKRKQQMKGKK